MTAITSNTAKNFFNRMRASALWKLLAALALLVAVDQFSKSAVPEVVFNPGFFLGSLSWMSEYYRVFCTLILLSLSFITIGLLQFLLWSHHRAISYSLLLLQAGFLGNGLDKLRFGQVRDFIPIRLMGSTLVLNLADLYLWCGIGALLYFLWSKPDELWPKNNLRGHWLVFPKSQMRMTGVLMLVSGLSGASGFLMILAYLKQSGVPFDLKEMTLSFFVFYGIVLSVVFLFGIRWSHRIFGPFRAVERYLETHPNSRPGFQLRDSDENECVVEVLQILEKQSDSN